MNMYGVDNDIRAQTERRMVLKRGYIRDARGAHPWDTSDYYAFPKCDSCGAEMKESYVVLTQAVIDNLPIKTPEIADYPWRPGQNLFTWWCGKPGCEQATARHWRQRSYQANQTIRETDIEKIPVEVLQRFGIPDRYVNCTLDAYKDHPKYTRLCRDYVDSPDHSMLFTGPCGTGKTHLAIAILRELYLKGRDNLYFKTVTDLLIDITGSFRPEDDSDDYRRLIDSISRYDVLVLDDLGAEKPTEFAVTTLYTIINRRLNYSKQTIVTTNLKLDDIRDRLSERIASRLAEYQIIPFAMPDRRKVR